MRLKEIKPGMVVHVKNDEEYKELLKEAKRLGYRWLNGKEIDPEIKNSLIQSYSIKFNEANDFRYFKNIGFVLHNFETIEFSDLVLPDLTAEEAIEWMATHYEDGEYKNLFGCDYTMGDILDHLTPNVIVKCIEQWKQEHEKKEPEIETVDICRIIDIQPDGKKRCVHEEHMENIPIEEGKVRPSDRNIQKRCREILKRYCMEHEGEFIAVHEVVSRVKAVE